MALANQNELTCSIEIVKQEGDGRAQQWSWIGCWKSAGKNQSRVLLPP